jgi:hypothetical protein
LVERAAINRQAKVPNR